MNKQEFYWKCRYHDWGYEYSDDHNVWYEGRKSRLNLLSIVQEQPELKPIYDAFIKHSFYNEPLPELESL